MAKTKLEPKVIKNLIYPYVPMIVGVNVGGKPNYITVGLIGWLCYDVMSISVGHEQYSRSGLLENGTFSINQPTAALVKQLDYCGIASGRKTDKAELFDTFYGELETAPMIGACPINIECRVVQTLIRPIHTVFLGEVAAVHASEEFLQEGVPDLAKIQPVFYAPDPLRDRQTYSYWSLGEKLGHAFEIGKDLATR
ncbi:MAG: flavin reductase family protein [Candidatus Bipolaricaulia bacterium]